MSESLRVLLVTLDYPPPPGGIQTIVRNLERGLDELGHEPEVLHIDSGDVGWRPRDLLPRPRWLYSAESLTSGDFVYMNVVYRRTAEAIERFDPDVVHAMHVKDWPAIVAARERDIPTALSTYALELGIEDLASRAVRDADVTHALTEFTESLVLDAAPGEETRTAIIPPSIEVSKFEAARGAADDGPGDVVTMARFVDRKNIETVVRAWKRLDGSVSEGRDLVVAGDGPNRKRLEGLAEGRDDVRFTGWVNGAQKRGLLADADVFAMVPRRNGYDVEGFGIVYIEAQAAGTPVVGSTHGGAPEAIDGAGLTVNDEDDPDEVAGAIERLLTDEELRRDRLAAAHERIRGFDVSTVARRHVEMYRDVS